MRGRIAELRALRGLVQAGDPAALDGARAVGQALRGSGATFGFPELSAVAGRLESSADRDVLRRVEGLITELHSVAGGGDGPVPFRAEWLLRAADLPVGDGSIEGVEDTSDAWERVGRDSGLGPAGLAMAVARYFDLQPADLAAPSRCALRLVPEALVLAGRVLPLSEDASTITVATCEPASLPLELELLRLTGRVPIFTVAPPAALDAAIAAVLDRPPAPSGALRPAIEPDLPRTGVLVVDDEPSVRAMVGALLSKKGYGVVEAEDGEDALERLSQEPSIGLVVADLNMPRMDGLELIWEIRATSGRERLPVIVVTAETDEMLETQLIEEGADDYIRKPIDVRLFLARVAATMRRAGA